MNLPNFITLIRLLLIPVVAGFLLCEQMIFAGIVFIVSCVTDVLDGYIARKLNQVTNLGKLLDPIADKGMTLVLLAGLSFEEYIPWGVTLLLLLKETLMFLGGVNLFLRRVVVEAKWYGKAATVVSAMSLLYIMFFLHKPFPKYVVIFQLLPLLCGAFAFGMYMLEFHKINVNQRRKQNDN